MTFYFLVVFFFITYLNCDVFKRIRVVLTSMESFRDLKGWQFIKQKCNHLQNKNEVKIFGKPLKLKMLKLSKFQIINFFREILAYFSSPSANFPYLTPSPQPHLTYPLDTHMHTWAHPVLTVKASNSGKRRATAYV